MTTKNATFRAIEFDNAVEAIHAAREADCGRAIRIDGRYLVIDASVGDRLAAARVAFAYLGEHPGRDGSYRIMTVPVN